MLAFTLISSALHPESGRSSGKFRESVVDPDLTFAPDCQFETNGGRALR
jgi:hypothetical protein